MNFLSMESSGSPGEVVLKSTSVTVPLSPRYQAAVGAASGRKVVVGLRPEHFELGEPVADCVAVQAKADVVEYLGNDELIHLSLEGKDLIAIVPSSHMVRPGDVLRLNVPMARVHMFDAETGDSLLDRAAAA